jgi:hypothetical protein
MLLQELSPAAVNSRSLHTSRTSTRFCSRCHQQCPIQSFIQLDKHNGERILQYCSNCRDYFALRHEQNVAVGIGTPASSPNDSQASEECSRCGKGFKIAQFQKRLANSKIRVLKSCQSCREINNKNIQSCRQNI